MARTYTLRKRAEQQAETRKRIVEAAVELYGSVGAALTTVTMVAVRVGVQRHTFYAHFSDERSLMQACSGLAIERDPFPDAALWQSVSARGDRLRMALSEIYDWYARNADLTACVLRDSQHHALTREVTELRTGPVMAACGKVLGAACGPLGRAALSLALSFHKLGGARP